MSEWDGVSYERLSDPQLAWGLRVLERLAPRAGELVLDVGCGSGRLSAELATVRPRVIVCLGATAAQALLGRSFRVTKMRGRALETPLGTIVATVHPSSILRAPDDATRHLETARFIADLKAIAALL